MPDWTDRAARRMYEGAGLGPADVDVFNPYDGYAPMAQFFLEGFQWHGVKRGRYLRVLRGRYQGRGAAPVLLERRQSGERAYPYGHVHRQHRAAPRHRRPPPGHGPRRNRAGSLHHAKQRRLDHVRQIPELTAVIREITDSRRSLSAACSAIGQNLTLGTRCEGRLMPHSSGFDLVALAVGCAPKSAVRSSGIKRVKTTDSAPFPIARCHPHRHRGPACRSFAGSCSVHAGRRRQYDPINAQTLQGQPEPGPVR